MKKLLVLLFVPLFSFAQQEVSHLQLGLDFYEADLFDKSIIEFNTSIETETTYNDVYYFRGRSYYYSDDYVNAEKDFTTYLGFNSEDTASYFFRRYSRLKLDKYDSSLSDLNKYISVINDLMFRNRS